MLRNPAPGGELPAEVEVLQRMKSREKAIHHGDNSKQGTDKLEGVGEKGQQPSGSFG